MQGPSVRGSSAVTRTASWPRADDVGGDHGRVIVAPQARRPARATLTTETYEVVKAMVMDHRIEPDTKVNIDALARDLEVSQTPVREALAALESEGLVVKQPLRGYRTTPLLTGRQLAELFEMRFLIERWSAEHAAARIDDAGRDALRAELATCSVAPDGGAYEGYRVLAQHDARFHDLILALAGNEAIREFWDRAHCHLHLFRLHYTGSSGTRALIEHRELVDAICSGDPELASEAMRRHIQAAFDRFKPATAGEQPAGADAPHSAASTTTMGD